MDHSCYKCGHSIEDGKPFCLQCGAPQIRVVMPEAAVSIPAGDSSSVDLPIFPNSPTIPAGLGIPTTHIHWPSALRACAVAASIAALLMGLRLMVPLLAVLGAGFLGVNLYHRRNMAWNVNARSGALLGAVCGVLFFGIASVLETVAMALFHTGGEVRQKVMEVLQQAAARSNDPQVQATVDLFKTPEGLALMLAFGLVFFFLVSIAAGSLAGALTGAFLGRRKRL